VDADRGIHPDFARWADRQRPTGVAASAAAPGPERPEDEGPERERPDRTGIEPGDLLERFHLDPDTTARLIVTAARMAAGLVRSTRRSVIVWVEGDSELAIDLAGIKSATAGGRIDILLPVRCDQTGPAEVIVTFAVGQEDRPAGMFASTARRPTGPKLIVDTWGDALVAFAWRTLLTLTSQVAGAIGKDSRGNVLVPADLMANADGLFVRPMGRFRFSGSGFSGTTKGRT
jgi:hypothetical protein